MLLNSRMVCERPPAAFGGSPPHEGEIKLYSPPREGETRAKRARGSLTHHPWSWATCVAHRVKSAVGKPASVVQFAVETQVLTAEELRNIDNLAIMQPKMFDDLINGL